MSARFQDESVTNPYVPRENAPDPDSLGSRHTLGDPSLSSKRICIAQPQQPISYRKRRHNRVGYLRKAPTKSRGTIRSTRVSIHAGEGRIHKLLAPSRPPLPPFFSHVTLTHSLKYSIERNTTF